MPEVPPGYEEKATKLPGEVDLDLLFALLDEDEGGRRYEAATAAGHVADSRPDRLRPHVADLLDALEDDPNEVLGDSPWDTSVLGWLVLTLNNVAAAYPEEVLPTLLDAAEQGPPLRREGALRALAKSARTYPEWFVPRLERVEQFLVDELPLRMQAFRLFATVASGRPDAVEHLVPHALDGLVKRSLCPEAARLLARVGKRQPSVVRPAVPRLRNALAVVEARDAAPVCDALFVVATDDPDSVRPAEDHLRELLGSDDHTAAFAAAKVVAEIE